jgi:hypothetical protein
MVETDENFRLYDIDDAQLLAPATVALEDWVVVNSLFIEGPYDLRVRKGANGK